MLIILTAIDSRRRCSSPKVYPGSGDAAEIFRRGINGLFNDRWYLSWANERAFEEAP
jgi:hypothetical protein